MTFRPSTIRRKVSYLAKMTMTRTCIKTRFEDKDMRVARCHICGTYNIYNKNRTSINVYMYSDYLFQTTNVCDECDVLVEKNIALKLKRIEDKKMREWNETLRTYRKSVKNIVKKARNNVHS